METLNDSRKVKTRTMPYPADSRLKVDESEAAGSKPYTEKELWVQKYAPMSVHDLLTSDSVNAEVLSWVGSWRKCAFGDTIGRRRRDAPHDPLERPEKKV